MRTLLGQLHCEKGVGEWGEFTGDNEDSFNPPSLILKTRAPAIPLPC